MAGLHFTEDGEAGYQRLLADPARKVLLTRVEDVLDLLQENPGDQRLRRRRFARANMWAVPIRDHEENWLVLWRRYPALPDTVVITYIGPDSFG